MVGDLIATASAQFDGPTREKVIAALETVQDVMQTGE